ncbi:DNA alkylation repair protein, partial [Candidatus Termititenax persephonae]
MKIMERLNKLAKGNAEYRKFNARIINDATVKYIGVRTPDLKKIAREIAQADWQEFLKNNNWHIYEMKAVAFYLPQFLKLDFAEFFALYARLSPYASSWANCDCLGIKKDFIRQNPVQSWRKIAEYLNSGNGWAVRIGLNLVFANFLDAENIDRTLAEIKKIDSRYHAEAQRGTLDYYVKMMLAWTLAEVAVKQRVKVENILPKLDRETAKYTKQKMRDSRRI